MKLLTNLLFEPKGKHNPALAYSIKDTVMSADGSQVYFALQDVPTGIALNDERYWKLQIDLSGSKHAMDEAVANFSDYARIVGTRVKGETAKATGNPATFLPDAGSLLQPVTVLEPQQEGSGEPSPENIRPFIGYDKLNLNHAGKNLIGGWAQGAVNSKGEEFSSSTVIRSAITKVGKKNVFVTVPDGLGYFLVEYADGTFLSRTDRNASQAFTLRDNTTHIRLCLVKNDGSAITPSEAVGYQVEYGTVGTQVVPYQGKLHTVQIDQVVYGLRYEWLTGRGVIEWAMQVFDGSDDENWMVYTSGSGAISFYNGVSVLTGIAATGDFRIPGACSWAASEQGYIIGIVRTGIDADRMEIPHETLVKWGVAANLDAFKAKLAANPMQIAYKLATPVEIQRTPHIISAVEPEQTNTLYGDGVIETTYVKPLHVSIEERVAAALAAMTE